MNRLEFSIKICEHLPFDITLFEENGLCKKEKLSLDYCHYCEKSENKYLCKKKTYTPSCQEELPTNLKNPYQLLNI